jgi:hypothetical protein
MHHMVVAMAVKVVMEQTHQITSVQVPVVQADIQVPAV